MVTRHLHLAYDLPYSDQEPSENVALNMTVGRRRMRTKGKNNFRWRVINANVSKY